jgi:hypothetical protein
VPAGWTALGFGDSASIMIYLLNTPQHFPRQVALGVVAGLGELLQLGLELTVDADGQDTHGDLLGNRITSSCKGSKSSGWPRSGI